MMDLDEAIRHAEEVANTNERLCETVSPAMQLSDYGKCAEEHRQLAEWLKELKAYKEQDGDAISRQAVLNGLASIAKAKAKSDAQKSLMGRVMFFTERLPSVTPQQRTGRWIEHFDEIGKWYECDQCHTDWGGSVNYCHNCGAKDGGGRMTDREKAIATLTEHLDHWKRLLSEGICTKDEGERTIYALTFAIENIQSIDPFGKPNKWIPVSERVPENNDDVLVYDNSDIFVAWYSGIKGNWCSADNRFDEYTPILAWMPLPAPFRAESEVQE